MKFKRAIQIGTLSQAAQFALSFVSVVVVSRLLNPSEIGVFSVAVSLLGFAHVFREFGVGQYLVQVAKVSRENFRAAFTVALTSAWVIALVLLALSHPMARFYGNDGVGHVLMLAALNFLILPFGTPVLALLQRDLRFDLMAWVAIAGAAVQCVVTIGAAWLGQSYLSMAWGTLAMTITKMLFLNILRPGQTFVVPTTRGLRDVLRFGALASSASMTNTAGDAAPDLILGKALGFADVALFSRATSVQLMLVGKINELVRLAHLPLFAERIRSGEAPAALFVNVSSHLAIITVPLLLLFAVVADPLIPTIFGPQWERSADLATILSVGSAISAPFALCGASLVATGHVGAYARATLLIQSVRVATLLCAFVWPLETLTIALIAFSAFESLVIQRQLGRTYGLTSGQTVRLLWQPWLAGLGTVAGPLALRFVDMPTLTAPAASLAYLALSGLLAPLGWLLFVRAVRHPIGMHIPLIRSR